MRITDELALPAAPSGISARPRRHRATPRQREQMAVLEIGSLRDDVDVLAACVARASACIHVTVWIDDRCLVRGTSADTPPPVPVHWIVGTYACGASLADIADDLRHERQERERAWQLD
ncbi:hypothetical protein [Dokdonella sp.]|uniref:hypothetical protein n=1 Tax=Dokdonella sp. TaxID=2291710 RepID=UPI001AFD1AD9|nr:hypothetical protein [Dokdonella sp.]MBO9662862.1 hypothetical protein [Dokdonella sp.]